MINTFKEIQGNELESLIEKSRNDIQVQIALKELDYTDLTFKNNTGIIAKKYESNDLNITFLNIEFKENDMNLLIIFSGTKTTVTLNIMEKLDDIKIINSYCVSNKHLKHSLTYLYNKSFKESLLEINKMEFPEKLEKESIVKSNLPCLYGNWCGPGCSGPDAPISKVDACCKKHDECYRDSGYFNCDCDKKLIQDLARYYYQGSEWAILITEYFKRQYEHNCK